MFSLPRPSGKAQSDESKWAQIEARYHASVKLLREREDKERDEVFYAKLEQLTDKLVVLGRERQDLMAQIEMLQKRLWQVNAEFEAAEIAGMQLEAAYTAETVATITTREQSDEETRNLFHVVRCTKAQGTCPMHGSEVGVEVHELEIHDIEDGAENTPNCHDTRNADSDKIIDDNATLLDEGIARVQNQAQHWGQDQHQRQRQHQDKVQERDRMESIELPREHAKSVTKTQSLRGASQPIREQGIREEAQVVLIGSEDDESRAMPWIIPSEGTSPAAAGFGMDLKNGSIEFGQDSAQSSLASPFITTEANTASSSNQATPTVPFSETEGSTPISLDSTATGEDDDYDMAEITLESLEFEDDGVVFTYPPILKGVPLERISREHWYFKSCWHDLDAFIQPTLDIWTRERQANILDKSLGRYGLANRQFNRGNTIREYLKHGEISPYQLIGKEYIREDSITYNRLFRIVQVLEELGRFTLQVTPLQWFRHRLHEIWLERGGDENFNIWKVIDSFYSDRKMKRLRSAAGFGSIGRPSGFKLKNKPPQKNTKLPPGSAADDKEEMHDKADDESIDPAIASPTDASTLQPGPWLVNTINQGDGNPPSATAASKLADNEANQDMKSHPVSAPKTVIILDSRPGDLSDWAQKALSQDRIRTGDESRHDDSDHHRSPVYDDTHEVEKSRGIGQSYRDNDGQTEGREHFEGYILSKNGKTPENDKFSEMIPWKRTIEETDKGFGKNSQHDMITETVDPRSSMPRQQDVVTIPSLTEEAHRNPRERQGKDFGSAPEVIEALSSPEPTNSAHKSKESRQVEVTASSNAVMWVRHNAITQGTAIPIQHGTSSAPHAASKSSDPNIKSRQSSYQDKNTAPSQIFTEQRTQNKNIRSATKSLTPQPRSTPSNKAKRGSITPKETSDEMKRKRSDQPPPELNVPGRRQSPVALPRFRSFPRKSHLEQEPRSVASGGEREEVEDDEKQYDDEEEEEDERPNKKQRCSAPLRHLEPDKTDLEYDGYTSHDSYTEDPITEEEWRVYQVKMANIASNTNVTQFWHWIAEEDWFEHQVLKDVYRSKYQGGANKVQWSTYRCYNFHLRLAEIAEIRYSVDCRRVIIGTKVICGVEHRGDVLAHFKRERTKRRFLTFMKQKGINLVKTDSCWIEQAWRRMDSKVLPAAGH